MRVGAGTVGGMGAASADAWDEERVANEVASYRARVEAERRSQEAGDDQEADAARVAAPDTRAVAVGRALH